MQDNEKSLVHWTILRSHKECSLTKVEKGSKLEINRIKLEENRRKFEKYANIWKLNKILLITKKKSQGKLENILNSSFSFKINMQQSQSIWDVTKADHRRKLITLNFFVKKEALFVTATLGEGNGTLLQYSCLENPMDGGAGRLQSMGFTKSRTLTERLHFHFSLSCTGEGNGNPLQCSCLENPRDSGSLVGCRLWGHTESDTTEVT